MRLLVLGASGLVGSNIVAASLNRNWSVVGTYRSHVPAFETPLYHLNILNSKRFHQLIHCLEPDAVINCVAMTDVDECEENPEKAKAVNAIAPGILANLCDKNGITFVHLSTDYVFDGETNVPYEESSITNPIQKYGCSKLAGEQKVKNRHSDPLIVRLSFVYGLNQASSSDELVGFPAWVRDRLIEGKSVPLFTDQNMSPTQADHASKTILDLLHGQFTGTFHVTSRSCTTPYEFGTALCTRLDAERESLERTSLADVDRPANRPRYTCLNVEKLESHLGRKQPRLVDGLELIDDHLLK